MWKPVPGVDGLEASTEGHVRVDGVLCRTYGHPGGYRKTEIAGRQYYIHRLVALAFCGAPTGSLVRHLDGDPRNNVPSNLAWGTTSENLKDAVRHGTYRNGAMGKTNCPQGHPYSEPNTYITPKGWRGCRECLRANTARYRARKKQIMERGTA